jgi:hypothetical protein
MTCTTCKGEKGFEGADHSDQLTHWYPCPDCGGTGEVDPEPAAPAVTDDVMAAIRARHDQDDIRHSCVADSEGQSCCFDDPEVVAKLLAAAAPTLEERRTVRLDNEGVEWFACDPYPTWYRRVDGEVLTLTSLGDEFCGWAAASTVDEANEGYDRRDSYAEGYDDGSAAALAAAPTVEDLVWCDGHEEVLTPYHCYFHARLSCQDPSCGPCTASRHTLLLGHGFTP